MPVWLVQLLPNLLKGLGWLIKQLGLFFLVTKTVENKAREAKLEEVNEAGKMANDVANLSDDDIDDLLRHDKGSHVERPKQ